jgi:hypothetical protein
MAIPTEGDMLIALATRESICFELGPWPKSE